MEGVQNGRVKLVISKALIGSPKQGGHMEEGKHKRKLRFALESLTMKAQELHNRLPRWQSVHKVVRLGINPMIQPEPEDLPKDNPKLEIAVLRVILFSIHNDEWKSFQCHHQTALRILVNLSFYYWIRSVSLYVLSVVDTLSSAVFVPLRHWLLHYLWSDIASSNCASFPDLCLYPAEGSLESTPGYLKE
ncbi:hypothetical protein Tco_0641735 [Tanacetum coccineum]